MTRPLISIVLPVYNGQAFIQETLKAVLTQSTPQIEVIVVDDGSTDNTAEIIKQSFKSAVQAHQLMLYKQENQGVSSARNLGVERARGGYIAFIDADDVVLPEYVEVLLKSVAKGVDIVEFGYKTFVGSIIEMENNPAKYSNTQFGLHEVSDVLDTAYGAAKWYPWTRVFKRALFEGVRFPIGVSFCEDLMTIPYLYEKSNSILVLADTLYAYRKNIDSATYTIKSDYVENLVKFYNQVPNVDLIRYRYWKLSVAFSIASCQSKDEGDWQLPEYIQKEVSTLRWHMSVYRDVSLRTIGVVLYPNLYKNLKTLFRMIKKAL